MECGRSFSLRADKTTGAMGFRSMLASRLSLGAQIWQASRQKPMQNVVLTKAIMSSREMSSTELPWYKAHRAAPQGGVVMDKGLSKRQKRIIYRSSQRGWLELDILLGRWAAAHVPHITDDKELSAIERLLDAETPHVLQWVLGQKDPPAQMDSEPLRKIRRYVGSSGSVTKQ